jgi:two-component system NtrC family sensor kinase
VPLPSFALVRDIARALNRDQSPEEVFRAVVTLICSHFAARRATLWRRAPSGIQVVALTSPEDASAGEWTESARAGVIRVPLVHAGHRLGVLELEPGPGAPLDEETLGVVAEVLTPFVDAVLLSEDLASEVATRSRELSEQRRLFGLVIDTLPVGLYVIDREYRVLVWNRKRETGTQGLRRDQVVGRNVFEVLTRLPREQLKSEYDTVFETGELLQGDQVVEIAGERRVFRQSKIPMRLDGETISHVITIGEDVTERRQAEQRILQSEKLAAMGQLAAGVMHEINNPLATIGACGAAIEARLGSLADPTVQEYLGVIDREVHRCTRIVDHLLDFSRPRVQPVLLQRTPTPVNDLVNETIQLLRHHQRFRQLTIEKDLAPDLPRPLVDGERIIQAFMAIMLNAADAMEGQGVLRIRTWDQTSPPAVMVEFKDSGTGIPPEALDRIFEPFYTTKPPGRGTGLGLTISYGIIEEHGGRITVESTVGEGAAFRVVFPAVAGETS